MMERNTKQKRAVRKVLSEADRPLSVEEVFAVAHSEQPTLGVATVYRAIKRLLDEGVLAPVDLPGDSSRYEMAGKGHHHHFHCSGCDRVYETKPCLEDIRRLISPKFKITGHDIILRGLCPDCRNA
jgi:Fur family ferric uptake transcriptional regulator